MYYHRRVGNHETRCLAINKLYVNPSFFSTNIYLSIYLPHVHVSLVRQHTYLGQGREIRPHYYVKTCTTNSPKYPHYFV